MEHLRAVAIAQLRASRMAQAPRIENSFRPTWGIRSQSADCRSIEETISRLSKVVEVDEALQLKSIQNR
jgi:hypothetical protein